MGRLLLSSVFVYHLCPVLNDNLSCPRLATSPLCLDRLFENPHRGDRRRFPFFPLVILLHF